MRLVQQISHIIKTFGILHASSRVKSALRAKINELFRNQRHRSRIKSFNDKETVVISCLGSKFELKTNDYGLHRDLIADRIREPVATSLMLQYAKPSYVLLDVGANIGYFSLILSEKCQSVYAVEPDENNFNALNRNIELNEVENIHVFHLAFSDINETLYLNKSKKSNWHTTSKCSEYKENKVHATTIDEFCASHKIEPNIIKMDIEGFERYVIPSGRNVLKRIDYLFFELHSTRMSILEVNSLLDVIEESGLIVKNIIRYDRPGLWIEESPSNIKNIRKGDFGIYELIYSRGT